MRGRALGSGSARVVEVRSLRGIAGVFVASADCEFCFQSAVREQWAATWRTHRPLAGSHRRAAQLCDSLASHHEGRLRRRLKSSERGSSLERGGQRADEHINVQRQIGQEILGIIALINVSRQRWDERLKDHDGVSSHLAWWGQSLALRHVMETIKKCVDTKRGARKLVFEKLRSVRASDAA